MLLNFVRLGVVMLGLVTNLTVLSGAEPTLDIKAPSVKRFETAQTQIGYTDTKIFYTFGDLKTVLVITIQNNRDFSTSGQAHQFDAKYSVEDLDKWINNQHSDGLFADAPEPKSVVDLPKNTFKTEAIKPQGNQQAPQDNYEKYQVEFKLTEQKIEGKLTIKSATDTSTVYVKSK
jgi:hypothetical protein